MSAEDTDEVKQLPDEWRERAGQAHGHDEYWNGVANAYRELADELEEALNDG